MKYTVTYINRTNDAIVKIVEAESYQFEGTTATFLGRGGTPLATYREVREIEAEGVAKEYGN